MVNVDLLKAHAGNYKMTRDNAAEIYRQLFTLHKETAPYFDAEDIDPDHILKSNKFLMGGQMLLPVFFRLPQVAADDRQWRRVLSEFKEQFEDSSFPMSEFNKLKDPFFETMKLHAGGLTPEQKKEWGALLDKAYTDMKSFGWY